MNKVIRGKRYDTSTAEWIADIDNYSGDCLPGDLFYWQEILYRKRTGEFFVYRKGGAGTSYCDGEIEPLDTEEAKEWVEENCDGNTYEELFGDVGEGEKKSVCISLTEQESQKIKAYALERKISVSEAIGKLIRKL